MIQVLHILTSISIYLSLITLSNAQFDYLILTSASNLTSDLTTYSFEIYQTSAVDITTNSIIRIQFPSDYQGILTDGTHNCYQTSWPASAPSPVLSCSINNVTLTITGGFSTTLVFNTQNTFIISVQQIRNIPYASSTAVFNGTIANPANNVLITFFSFIGLSFDENTMTCSLSSSPTTINSIAQMIVSITPTFILPLATELQITIPRYWPKNAVNTTNSVILQSSLNCISVQNVASNIACSSVSTTSYSIMTVTNLLSLSTNQNLKFSISSIKNPPTVQPQGSIQIVAKQSGKKMYICSEVKMQGTTSNSISSASYKVQNYIVNANSKGYISFKVNSLIINSDSIQIDFPSTIGLSNLSSVLIVNGNVYEGNPQISSNVVSLSGLSAQNSVLVQIQFTNITNPPSQKTTDSFIIQLKRNNYMMQQLKSSLTFNARRGSITVISLSASSTQVGTKSNYTLILSLNQNLLLSSSSLEIKFPTAYQTSVPENCSPLPCLISSRLVTFTSISTTTLPTQLTLYFYNITNPYTIGSISSLTATTYLNSSQSASIVQQATSGITFTLGPRQLQISNVTLTTSSNVVYNFPTTYTFTIANNNPLPAYFYIEIVLPPRVTTSAQQIACIFDGVGIGCSFNSSTSTVTLSTLSTTDQTSGFLSSKSIQLLNLYNPPSTRSTQSFSIYILNPLKQIIQYLNTSLTFTALTAEQFNTLSLLPNNSINSAYTQLSVSFSTKSTYINNSVLALVFPIYIDVQQVSCSIISSNLLSISCTKSPNDLKIKLIYSSLSELAETSFKVTNYKNFPSLQTYSIIATLYQSSAQLYKISQQTATIVNTQLNTITINSYSFINPVLYELSDLTISLTPTGVNSALSYILIQLPSQFDVTNAGTCVLPIGIVCTLNQKIFKIQPSSGSTFTFPLSITLKSITTPTFTPSSSLYIQSYSNSDSLMDRSYSLYFSTQCTIPCKVCSLPSLTTCTACYSNASLVSSKTILSGNICTSLCSNGYYMDGSTNQCEKCHSVCETCLTYSECTSCATGKYLFNSTCLTSCTFGYYPYSTFCLACPSSLFCQSCSVSSSCLTCISGYYYYNGFCLSTCPNLITYAYDLDKKCYSCPTNCTKCTGSNNDVNCTVCQVGYYLDQSNYRCYTQCLSIGTVPNGKTCSSCSSICLTCINSTTTCTSCDTTSLNPYLVNNFCLSSCPSGYYADTSTFVCNLCLSPCQICQNISVHSCKSCVTGYYLYQLDNSCVTSCPMNYYGSTTKCIACVAPCQQCSSESVCKSCITGYYLYSTRCVTSCDSGMTIINGNQCLVCASQCKTCSASTYCTSCYFSNYLYDGNCSTLCPNATYPDSNSGACLVCVAPCYSCSSSTFCTSCISNQLYLNLGSCVSSCPTPKIAIGKICQSCQAQCSTCINDTSTCIACSVSYPYFYQKAATCSSSCNASIYINASINYCVQSCPSLMFSNSTSYCQSCPTGCTVCISLTNCSSCNTNGNYSFYSDFCYSPCPVSQPYSINGVCNLCNITNCQICDNQTHCQSCTNMTLLIQTDSSSSCISSCPTNYIYNDTTFACQYDPTTSNNTNSNSSSSNTSTSSNQLIYDMNTDVPQFIWVMIFGGFLLVFLISKCQFPQQTNLIILLFLAMTLLTTACLVHISVLQLRSINSFVNFLDLKIMTYLITAIAAFHILANVISVLVLFCIRDHALIDVFQQYPLVGVVVIGLAFLIDYKLIWILNSGFFSLKILSLKYSRSSMIRFLKMICICALIEIGGFAAYGVIQFINVQKYTQSRLLFGISSNSIKENYLIQIIVLTGCSLVLALGMLLLPTSYFYLDDAKDTLKTPLDDQKHHEMNKSQQQLRGEDSGIFHRRFNIQDEVVFAPAQLVDQNSINLSPNKNSIFDDEASQRQNDQIRSVKQTIKTDKISDISEINDKNIDSRMSDISLIQNPFESGKLIGSQKISNTDQKVEKKKQITKQQYDGIQVNMDDWLQQQHQPEIFYEEKQSEKHKSITNMQASVQVRQQKLTLTSRAYQPIIIQAVKQMKKEQAISNQQIIQMQSKKSEQSKTQQKFGEKTQHQFEEQFLYTENQNVNQDISKAQPRFQEQQNNQESDSQSIEDQQPFQQEWNQQDQLIQRQSTPTIQQYQGSLNNSEFDEGINFQEDFNELYQGQLNLQKQPHQIYTREDKKQQIELGSKKQIVKGQENAKDYAKQQNQDEKIGQKTEKKMNKIDVLQKISSNEKTNLISNLQIIQKKENILLDIDADNFQPYNEVSQSSQHQCIFVPDQNLRDSHKDVSFQSRQPTIQQYTIKQSSIIQDAPLQIVSYHSSMFLLDENQQEFEEVISLNYDKNSTLNQNKTTVKQDKVCTVKQEDQEVKKLQQCQKEQQIRNQNQSIFLKKSQYKLSQEKQSNKKKDPEQFLKKLKAKRQQQLTEENQKKVTEIQKPEAITNQQETLQNRQKSQYKSNSVQQQNHQELKKFQIQNLQQQQSASPDQNKIFKSYDMVSRIKQHRTGQHFFKNKKNVLYDKGASQIGLPNQRQEFIADKMKRKQVDISSKHSQLPKQSIKHLDNQEYQYQLEDFQQPQQSKKQSYQNNTNKKSSQLPQKLKKSIKNPSLRQKNESKQKSLKTEKIGTQKQSSIKEEIQIDEQNHELYQQRNVSEDKNSNLSGSNSQQYSHKRSRESQRQQQLKQQRKSVSQKQKTNSQNFFKNQIHLQESSQKFHINTSNIHKINNSSLIAKNNFFASQQANDQVEAPSQKNAQSNKISLNITEQINKQKQLKYQQKQQEQQTPFIFNSPETNEEISEIIHKQQKPNRTHVIQSERQNSLSRHQLHSLKHKIDKNQLNYESQLDDASRYNIENNNSKILQEISGGQLVLYNDQQQPSKVDLEDLALQNHERQKSIKEKQNPPLIIHSQRNNQRKIIFEQDLQAIQQIPLNRGTIQQNLSELQQSQDEGEKPSHLLKGTSSPKKILQKKDPTNLHGRGQKYRSEKMLQINNIEQTLARNNRYVTYEECEQQYDDLFSNYSIKKNKELKQRQVLGDFHKFESKPSDLFKGSIKKTAEKSLEQKSRYK